MNRKRAQDGDFDDDDDSDTCPSVAESRSTRSSTQDFFDQGLPQKKKGKKTQTPDPRIPITLEEILEAAKPREAVEPPTAPAAQQAAEPAEAEEGEGALVIQNADDEIVLIEGCPLCAAQAHVRTKNGYAINAVSDIDEIIHDSTFYSDMTQIFTSIAFLVNNTIRMELKEKCKVATVDCTVEMVRVHYMQGHRIDPGIITHQMAKDTTVMMQGVKNDIFKQNPLTQGIEVNYTAANTFMKMGTFLFKTLSTDLTKLSGYQVGTTSVNPNRKKASLVQISNFSV